jgi:hypothetical protein
MNPANFPPPPPNTVKPMCTPFKPQPQLKTEDTIDTDITLGGSTAVNSFNTMLEEQSTLEKQPSSDGNNSVNSLLLTISNPTTSATKTREPEPKTPSKPPKESKGIEEGDKLIDKLLKSVKKGEKAAKKAQKAEARATAKSAKAEATSKAQASTPGSKKRKASQLDSEPSLSSGSDTEDDDVELENTPSENPSKVNIDAEATPRKSLPRRSKSITPSSAYFVDEEGEEAAATAAAGDGADDSPTPVCAVSVTVEVPTNNPDAADTTPPATAAASNVYITVPSTPTASANASFPTTNTANKPRLSNKEKIINARTSALAKAASNEDLLKTVNAISAEEKAELKAKGIDPLIHHFKVLAEEQLVKEGRIQDWVTAAAGSGAGEGISGKKDLDVGGAGKKADVGHGSVHAEVGSAGVGGCARGRVEKGDKAKKVGERMPYSSTNLDDEDDADYGTDDGEGWTGKSEKKKGEKKIGWRERVEAARKKKP